MSKQPTLTYDTGEGITFSVEFDRWDALQTNRARWRWVVQCGDVSDEGDDLTTVPPDGAAHYPQALGALLSFLSAAREQPDTRGCFSERLHQAFDRAPNGDMIISEAEYAIDGIDP